MSRKTLSRRNSARSRAMRILNHSIISLLRLLFDPLDRRVERSLLRQLPKALDDAVAVERPSGQGLEDEQVESPLQELRLRSSQTAPQNSRRLFFTLRNS